MGRRLSAPLPVCLCYVLELVFCWVTWLLVPHRQVCLMTDQRLILFILSLTVAPGPGLPKTQQLCSQETFHELTSQCTQCHLHILNQNQSKTNKDKLDLEFPSLKDESAFYIPDHNRKRKASYLDEPLDKRFRGNPAEEDNPKLRFEAKYVELHPLGEGGCGSVFAGYRRSDHLDVAIKHVPNKYQYCKHVDEEGRQLSGEVAVMLKLRSGTSHSAGSRAPIALLDWYVLPHELILVLERPMPAVDLQTYVEERRDSFGEKEAKMILKQLVKAAISLQDKKIFHRDIKVENILIDMSSGAPQVRLIDFGVSCFTESHSEYTTFYGTEIHAPPEWWYEHTYSARPTTVWQLGIVLFECLHNKRFNSTKLMEKKLQLRQNLSKDCKDFMKQCFIQNPRRRPSLEQILLHPWLK
uniref:non-specific serine/threonine protein kinase n=1 Tax=Oryzias latipes TaxID=8090 RepID=A0A3P9HBU2_ORYLA